ncbi:hypothetical protein Rhopal_006443-T1 [Rhodotorula paludigena]|uniref:Uncharacterized protein n=1 Tax=Rhodotorula paludigena TaxID=86838 RepID=A0AAV5GTX2_9BASI|nr:hypothetical protein Rhopal_006443-T1 [Rhodotorula paludigena]
MSDDQQPTRLQFLEQAFGEHAKAFESNLEDDKFKLEQQKSVFKKRAELAAKVPKFWSTSLQNCGQTAQFIDAVDEDALKALKDVWIEHSASDVREYEVRFTFGKNPYFKDQVLVKKVTLTPPKGLEPAPEKPAPYDLEAPVYLAEKTPIQWTSSEHDLTKKAPRPADVEGKEEYDDFDGVGSFFNWFNEVGEDRTTLGELLLEWWGHATEYAAGLASVDDDSGAEFDFDDELEDDESEDDEDPKKEIDLDDDEKKRPAKKQRR